MSTELLASIITVATTFGGCWYGNHLGRKAERGTWVAFVRAQYRANRESKDAGAFRVEMMAKAARVEKKGWRV